MPRFAHTLLFAFTVLAAVSLDAQTISIVPERPSALYQPGEAVRWQVTVTDDANLKTPTYTIKTGGLTTVVSKSLVLSSGKTTLEYTLKQPGWLLLEVDGTDKNGAVLQVYGGAMVGAEKITPGAARPDDFDTFWKAKLDELAAVPINARVTPGASGRTGVDYATVSLDCIRGTHVQGQLARPTAGAKFPALLIVQWAGVYSLQKSWATDRAAEGWLVLNTQAHDIAPIESDAYYTALSNGALKDYWRQGNEDRETSYYLRMYVACHRAAEYLTTRPDWDGRTLVVTGGSQGGLQALLTAAIHPKVTAAIAEVPAGSDQAGLDVGRVPGWPQWAWQAWDRDVTKVKQASRYYDITNFAPLIHCPVLIGVGLIDTVVPPPGVFATYNLLGGARQIVAMPPADHSYNHNAFYGPQSSWMTDARTARLPSLLMTPQPAAVRLGDSVSFSVVAANGQTFGYQWLKNGSPMPNANLEFLSIPKVAADDVADYAVMVTSPGGSVTSNPVRLSLMESPSDKPKVTLTGISTRAFVGAGDDLLIAGFVVRGTSAKRVLIRGVGPTLKGLGVDKPLADPQLTLKTIAGQQLATNDNWNDDPNAATIRDLTAAMYLSPLPEASKDAALEITLPPGVYSALLRGVSDGTGVGMVEVYDLDRSSESRLVAISSRSKVDPDNPLIAGYLINGVGNRRLFIRAMGPGLSDWNLNPLLPHPTLRIVTLSNVELYRNQGWEKSASSALLPSLSDQVWASPRLKAGNADSALLLSQSEGVCTAVVESTAGESGIAVVEVYEAPDL